MLKDLKEIYKDNNQVMLKYVNQVLELADVSMDKCHDSEASKFWIRYTAYGGRAGELMKQSREEQAKLCIGLWNGSLLSLVYSLDESDRESVSSMIKSMIDANNGHDFQGIYFDMPYENAQEGVLKFMDKRIGKTIKKRMKKEKFDMRFKELVFEPCDRVINMLSDEAERYSYLVRSKKLDDLLDPEAVKWAKYQHICKFITGYGYTSSPGYSFQQDLFQNLAYRKVSLFSGW